MKTIFLSFWGLFFSFCSIAQNVRIHGLVADTANCYLKYQLVDYHSAEDSVKISSDGMFSFQIECDGKTLCKIFVSKSQYFYLLPNVNDDINLTFKSKSPWLSSIIGSKSSNEFFNLFLAQSNNDTLLLKKTISKNIDCLSNFYFIDFLSWSKNRRLLKKLYEISEKYDNSAVVKSFREKYCAWDNTQGGKYIPKFELPDSSDNLVCLTNLPDKCIKIVFWSSWCKKSIDFLRDLKNNSNFAVYAVALDDDKNNWLYAVEQLNVEVKHVCDYLLWQSPIVSYFGVVDLPFVVNVSSKGKILSVEKY